AGPHVNDPVVETDPLTAADRDYDNKVLGAFQNAQARQGPLDGRWLIKTPDGSVLYALQINDPGDGPGQVEGVWRDPRTNGPDATGFIDQVSQQGGEMVLAFSEAGVARQLRLRHSDSGSWSGQVRVGVVSTTVLMLRDDSLEVAAAGAPPYVPPPAPKAKPRSKSKSKSKAKSKATPSLRR
ncbi:MAG: hypothetical protein WCI21_06930, partial [Alphaproteobacteria bacterium]